MKKILIVIVVIIFIVILSISLTKPNYSHEDIVALINKGIQNMNNMDNLSYDTQKEDGTVKHYYKGNKKKMITPTNNVFITLEDEKTYMIDKTEKAMIITTNSPLSDKEELQNEALRMEKFNKNDNQYRYELAYIRDEKIDNKTCILVKQCKFDKETKKYINYTYSSENQIVVYWIEKSTGFVIGIGFMDPQKNIATPKSIIKNIKCGEVTDDMFNDMLELPNDYLVLENNGNDDIVRVQ